MKVTENKPHSIHLRLTDEQYQFLSSDAEILGISVSDYVRMIVNTSMYASKKVAENIEKQAQVVMPLGGLEYEDIKNNQQRIV